MGESQAPPWFQAVGGGHSLRCPLWGLLHLSLQEAARFWKHPLFGVVVEAMGVHETAHKA